MVGQEQGLAVRWGMLCVPEQAADPGTLVQGTLGETLLMVLQLLVMSPP